MRILFVSIKAIHFRRWVSQLEDAGHELYFFNVSGDHLELKNMPFIHQNNNWKYRCNYPGRYFFKTKTPGLFKLFEGLNNKDLTTSFEAYLQKVMPDVVHSFVLYLSCAPILEVMKRYKSIPWIYSAWGNDLYYYQNISSYKKDILEVLPHIDYMFADCKRDITLARKLGFNGVSLGVYPGGGGYHIEQYNPHIKPLGNRNIILIKGYEQRFGKALNIVRACIKIKDQLSQYKVVVFGADKEFYQDFEQIKNKSFIDVYGQMSHSQVLALMGESAIYIGNSTSDGMPNTLLEAIIMGAFPIQSNPGGATEEIIDHNCNGIIVEDPHDIDEIVKAIKTAIENNDLVMKAFVHNQRYIKPTLEYDLIKHEVREAYSRIILDN